MRIGAQQPPEQNQKDNQNRTDSLVAAVNTQLLRAGPGAFFLFKIWLNAKLHALTRPWAGLQHSRGEATFPFDMTPLRCSD